MTTALRRPWCLLVRLTEMCFGGVFNRLHEAFDFPARPESIHE